MKYQVQIKYTNPGHEHVSLRRRVDTITRVVEAANEAEALNRAANQQRALGFLIKEAEVYAPVNGLHSLALNNNEPQKGKEKKKKLVGDDNETTDVGASKGVKEAAGTASYPLLKKGEKLKPMQMKEGFDPDLKDIAAHLIDKHGKGKVTKDHVDAYERDRDSNKAIDKEAVMKHVQKMSEDVELDEANMRFDYEAAARPKSSDVKNFLNRDKNPRAAAASKKYIRRMTKLGGLGPNQTKKDTEAHMKAHFEEVALDEMDKSQPSSSRGAEGLALGKKADPVKTDKVKSDALKLLQKQYKKVKEEVEQVDEASKEGKSVMYGMRASLKSMNLRHGVDSDKREAGYKMSPAVRAAQAKSDALSKVVKRPQAGTLAAAKMKKEAAENNGKQKARKAAEKMVNRVKSKANKIDVEPSIEPGKPNA